ncbi:low molecular weight protein-tyrosine-phosphatase [Methylomonas sp. MED-D]|uniref:protein-tyrosine-phosphatase n=1 Tax=Methylomonas koyamae TaxID=702114 RepID=A0A177NPL3_9GAMM|nr:MULTISPECIES: low molecular weight protein-tyrosine-phosphatase [Methylomonas]NJA06378.1 low molecular weight phosphotyrosine protein phosphatase [Methylococcaceae bacterium WWC4]OAI20016.1 phosphotyrosine protein phosphatase [Methylomonas koyamae]OHX37259.1 phosphotyrosine protein phosphatase [Methylomonas sp. LWB]
MNKIKVLFVCMGNICRSPTAEGVFSNLIESQNLADRFQIDSAGTHAYHVGDAPDLRAQKAARDRGVELKHLRARKVSAADFAHFDHILAMDSENRESLTELCPPDHRHKIRLFLEYAPHLLEHEVPDPYYGGSYGFERVLDLVEQASEAFLESLRQTGRL